MHCQKNTPLFGLAIYGLDLHFETESRIDDFAGNAWRGLLGRALFDGVCRYPAPACTACSTLNSCGYPALFKPLDPKALSPFWLHGWQRRKQSWKVQVRWAGDRSFAIGEWLSALGNRSRPLEMNGKVLHFKNATTPNDRNVAWRPERGWTCIPSPIRIGHRPPQRACEVRFRTPLISKHTGDPLYGALHTRVQRLIQRYGDGSAIPRLDHFWSCKAIAKNDFKIRVNHRFLAGAQWNLALSDIHPAAWTLLQLGVEAHAGGQTGMGCGQFEILSPS